MDFLKKTEDCRSVVEDELKKLFTADGLLTEEGIPGSLAEPLRYALLTGGKRLRPVLCLLACRVVSGDFKKAIPASLAIEVLHTYTLVHDDLPCMDDDLLRRGKPTVHAKYGYAEAVLVGDALHAAAFALALKTQCDAEALQKIVDELARAAGPAGVVGGQWVDVCSKPPHNLATVNYVHEHKTSDLVQCALLMGAIAARATEAQEKIFRKFGKNLGMAFQIIDDLLDGDDPAKTEEMSVLLVMDREEALHLAEKHTANALNCLEELEGMGHIDLEAVQILKELAQAQISRKM